MWHLKKLNIICINCKVRMVCTSGYVNVLLSALYTGQRKLASRPQDEQPKNDEITPISADWLFGSAQVRELLCSVVTALLRLLSCSVLIWQWHAKIFQLWKFTIMLVRFLVLTSLMICNNVLHYWDIIEIFFSSLCFSDYLNLYKIEDLLLICQI